MDQQELLTELSLSYDDQIEYLKRKYGEAVGNYFATASFASRNKKISRTSEGLQIHHVEERVCPNLAKKEAAVECPFEWQTPQFLVYCNLLEHLILHIKTSILKHDGILVSPDELLWVDNGIMYICATINDVYTKGEEEMSALELNYLHPIKDNYHDYIFLLQLMEGYARYNYQGSGIPTFSDDGRVCSNGKAFKVLRNKTFDIAFRDEEGNIIEASAFANKDEDKHRELAYLTGINRLRKEFIYTKINSREPGFSEQIFHDMRKNLDMPKIREYVQLLRQDFKGLGFPQFSGDLLDYSVYGAFNVDQYISEAFPSTIPVEYEIGSQKPVFWKGNHKNIKQYYDAPLSIIRIEVSFTIKQGVDPYVRAKRLGLLYKETIPYIRKVPYEGTIVGTSDIYRDGKYYARRKRPGAEEAEWVTIKLTLTREDYELFLEKHDIRFIKELDGCYFPE